MLCTALNANLARDKVSTDIRELQHMHAVHDQIKMQLEEVRFVEKYCRSYEKSVIKYIAQRKEALQKQMDSMPSKQDIIEKLHGYRKERIRLSKIISECESDPSVRRLKKKLEF